MLNKMEEDIFVNLIRILVAILLILIMTHLKLEI